MIKIYAYVLKKVEYSSNHTVVTKAKDSDYVCLLHFCWTNVDV